MMELSSENNEAIRHLAVRIEGSSPRSCSLLEPAFLLILDCRRTEA